MGYSCTAAAANVLDAIEDYLRAKYPTITKETGKAVSNGWTIDGHEFFFERGRENDDGAITGSVWESYFNVTTCDIRCRRVGNVRIEPNGSVTRFAKVPKSIIASVMAEVMILGHRPSIRLPIASL